MGRIAGFLGIPATPERLQTAIDRSAADRMRKLEQQQSEQWTGTKNTRKEIPFVRSASAGGWKNALPRRAAEEIEAAWFPLMNLLSYELSNPELDSSAVPAWAKVAPPR